MSLVEKYADPFADERVGIVADILTVQGGGEQVEATLAEQFNAPIYTLKWDPQRFSKEFVDKIAPRVIELQKEPSSPDDFEYNALDIMSPSPSVQLYLADLNKVDLKEISADKLVAASSEAAKIAYRAGKPYITYVNYPNKVELDYFWEIFDTKETIRDKFSLLKRRWRMVREGKKVAAESGHLMANSEYTMHAIHENWDVPYENLSVVNPPVEVSRYSTGEGADPFAGQEYFLASQRLEPYKNVHTLIEAAKRAQKHLVIVGSGTLTNFARREAQYSEYIHAFGYVSEERLIDLMRGAEATVQGTLREDFGIVPIESMACGTPCIAPASGGFLETIGDGYAEEPPETYRTERGLLIGPEDYSARGLAAAMQEFDADDYASSDDLNEYAQQYSVERFTEEVAECLEEI